MANIKTFIKKRMEAGDIVMNGDGDFLNKEKVTKLAQKKFMEEMKAGTLDLGQSFNKYLKDFTTSNFISLNDVLAKYEQEEEDGEADISHGEADSGKA